MVHGKTVYVGSQDRHLYAFDIDTGSVVWRYKSTGAIAAGATLSAGVIVVGDLDGRVHAVDMVSGSALWSKKRSSAVWGTAGSDTTRAFVPFEDGTVAALDLIDGSVGWTFETGDAVYGGVTVVEDSVYFASYDDWVYSVSADSGELRWRTELQLGSESTPTLAGGLVIIGAWDERVYALDAETGKLVWNFWAGDSMSTSVAASEVSAFFGAHDGYVYSITLADGALRWRVQVGDDIRSTPAVTSELLYVASGNTLFALDPATGSTVWRYTTGDEIRAPIVAEGDKVYLGSHDDSMYALAAGLPAGYVTSDDATITAPEPVPLSPRELKERLTSAFESQQPVLAFAHVFSGGQKSIELLDRSGLVVEIFETGYQLLTGRSVTADGWQPEYLTREDYDQLADEREAAWLKRSAGWCCIRTDKGLTLTMRGDRPQDAATATTAHEAGHALQRLLNPVQSKFHRDSLGGAMKEAEAYAFEVALARKIGEYTGVETARFPSGNYRYAAYLDQWRQNLRGSIEDVTNEHDRGRLIMWLAVLHDPELAHLLKELRRDGHVSSNSMLDMFYRFVSLTPSEIEPYVQSITPEVLSDDLNFIFGTVGKRVGADIEFPDLVINVPTLAMSP